MDDFQPINHEALGRRIAGQIELIAEARADLSKAKQALGDTETAIKAAFVASGDYKKAGSNNGERDMALAAHVQEHVAEQVKSVQGWERTVAQEEARLAALEALRRGMEWDMRGALAEALRKSGTAPAATAQTAGDRYFTDAIIKAVIDGIQEQIERIDNALWGEGGFVDQEARIRHEVIEPLLAFAKKNHLLDSDERAPTEPLISRGYWTGSDKATGKDDQRVMHADFGLVPPAPEEPAQPKPAFEIPPPPPLPEPDPDILFGDYAASYAQQRAVANPYQAGANDPFQPGTKVKEVPF